MMTLGKQIERQRRRRIHQTVLGRLVVLGHGERTERASNTLALMDTMEEAKKEAVHDLHWQLLTSALELKTALLKTR